MHTTYLFGLLVFLIICSAFFSSSETSMLSLNRYRLRHLDRQGHRGARRATRLLERPDRLLGTILVGNNIVNILAASIATVLAVNIWGEAGIAVATAVLTVVVLIFGEITPKTLAALRPELVAFPASHVLLMLQRLLYPVVWSTSAISNVLLRLLGIDPAQRHGGIGVAAARDLFGGKHIQQLGRLAPQPGGVELPALLRNERLFDHHF